RIHDLIHKLDCILTPNSQKKKNRPIERFGLALAAGFSSFSFAGLDDSPPFEGVAFLELAVGLAPFSAFSHVCPPVFGSVALGLAALS
ncbi:TPA: hypothetical protein ACGUTS_005091, partial [Vibrio vulnificus]